MTYPISSKVGVESLVVEIVAKVETAKVMMICNKWAIVDFFFFEG